MTPLEQAKEAVRKSRDFAPADGRRYNATEVGQINRLCREAYLACRAAGVTIGAMRMELAREELAAYRANLEALCARKEAAR
jgi:hypothetical protein